MRTYEGPATLILGGRSFEITLAIDEGQGDPGLPALGGAATLDTPEPWGGYYRLADPDREQELDAASSEVAKATLRLPDGRESEVSLHADRLHGVGLWPA
jgi:hypothetical protein